MIGAIEKQKLVYILNRDSSARLTISSPLEAHKSHTLIYHMVGVDVGFDNPMFATLELDYEVKVLHLRSRICSICVSSFEIMSMVKNFNTGACIPHYT